MSDENKWNDFVAVPQNGADPCLGCAFDGQQCWKLGLPSCDASTRADRQNIIWAKEGRHGR